MILSDNSKLLDNAVQQLSRLPGVGEKSAQRLALHLLRQPADVAVALGRSLIELREGVKYCRRCHNICDTELCAVCADTRRDSTTICVVETVKDVITLEGTNEYHGLYHVLGGIISPVDGVGPSDIEIDSLVERVKNEDVKEVILALSATMEGDTTNYYIFRRLADTGVKLSILARGVSVGGELEYTDSLTLGRSLLQRIPYENSVSR